MLDWTPWRPLLACCSDRGLSAAGLYRVRRAGRDDIDYIGQTGLALRARLHMLQGIYRAAMPYRDPHTAAPALWAQRQISGEDYEASTLAVAGEVPHRKAQEAVAIAIYRQEHGRSPTSSFGRMPLGYRMSSANNSRLVQAGRRFRGGPCDASEECHLPSLCPVGALDADTESDAWCGHSWSPWEPLAGAGPRLTRTASGLYRIRGRCGVLYVGEGAIASRLHAHAAKVRRVSLPQDVVFAANEPLECSWVKNNEWRAHQREELETDLIAAFAMALGSPPRAQFLG